MTPLLQGGPTGIAAARRPVLALGMRLWIGLFPAVLGLTISGCGGTTSAPVASNPTPRVPPVAQPIEPPTAATEAGSVTMTPARFTLAAGDIGLQLRVDEDRPDGRHVDLTARAAWRAEPSGVVAIEPGGYIRPLAAGSVTIHALDGDKRLASSEVTVSDPAQRPWDFAADIVPIFTRQGCNAGGCHGKSDGQNGFHLSLFGYDPEGDYQALTHEGGGRRVSVFAPDSSLLLQKATGRVPHQGGMRIAPGSDSHQALRAWVEAGAPFRRGEVHGEVVAVTVDPPAVFLAGPGAQQLRVIARFADGHERDVTRLATYRTNDDSAAEVGPQGLARLLRRAETDLVVRFGSSVIPVRIATEIHPDLKFDFKALTRRNAIDVELFKRLEALKVPPSPPASDVVFLRRVTLDLTGQQPLPDVVRSFVADPDPQKRIKLVDTLMKSPEFMKFWMIKLGDLLQITSARFPNAGRYQEWLQTRFAENAPWDAMVRELLTALGDPATRAGGPANYAFDGGDAKLRSEQTAQRFLGLRLRCAQCHDHPFDVWSQDDYYGMAAFFAKVRVGGPQSGPGGMMMARPVVGVDPDGRIEHQRTRQPAQPRLLGGDLVKLDPKDDPRKALAGWITRDDNPYFARAGANWVWAQFFGKGLTDPADDMSAANPPVHPALLDALASHFKEHHYDLRDLIRTVATSGAYELSSAPIEGNERDSRLFSHQMPRPLTAHQLADAISQATDVPYFLANRASKKGERAIDIFDPATPSAILDVFGRCSRRIGCSVVANPQLSLRQALLLIGGDSIDGKVTSLNGYLSRLIEYGTEPGDVVENLYLRALCRKPSDEERSLWTAELAASSSLREAAEDLFWALLNSREFAFNH